MSMKLSLAFASFVALLTLPLVSGVPIFVPDGDSVATVSESPMDEKQWFAILYYPREDLVQAVIDETVPAEDAAIVGKHFEYLKKAFASGQVIVAARTLAKSESDFGIAFFHASDIDAAREFMRNDPAVKAGVFRGEVRPISLALFAGKQ